MPSKPAQYLHISEHNRYRVYNLLKTLISRHSDTKLTIILKRVHASDLSQLWTFLADEEKEYILSILDVNVSADLLKELSINERTRILRSKNTKWLIDRLEELESDDVVDILKELPNNEANFIIRNFNKEYSEKIKQLMHYPERTAGALMTSDFWAINPDASVTSVIEQLRASNNKEEITHLHFIYVVDANNYLVGYISLKKLILEDGNAKAHNIMSPISIQLPPEMDQEEVAKVFKNHNLLVLPVVDDQGVMLGKITIDDIIDVLEEEASEDVFKMMGLTSDKLSKSVLESCKNRLPWAFINLLTSLVSASVISLFNHTLESFILLASFMPMVAGIGGATGNQMVAIIIRGLVLGEIHLRQVSHVLIQEIMSTFIGAIAIGSCISIFTYYYYHNLLLGSIVGLALTFNMVFATIIGAGIPLTLKFFKLDPAFGSSIFVSASTDIFGFIVFLGMASVILSK